MIREFSKTENSAKNGISLDCHFSEREILLLAKFFRNHQSEIPDELADFSNKIERAAYSTMTIEEAEVFFS